MSLSRSTRTEILGALSAGLLVVAFCLILLWHNPLVFWNDNYELSVLPVFADMARSWSEGHWPILSPYSWVCGNFAGEFQYGTFSIFVNAAVVLIWKFPLTFPQQAAALSIVHLFALAAGGFLLARGRRLSVALSIFVALIASLGGWTISWGATDWFGALGAFTWLPWAWWGAERALDSGRTKWRFLWPASFAYLLVTGGFQIGLVRCAWCVHLVAMGMVGSRTRFGFGTNEMAIPLAGVVRLSPRYGGISDRIGSVRLVRSPGCHGHGGEPNALWIRDERNGDSFGRRRSLISSLRGDFRSDWFGALGAFTWLPWAWWGAERALDSGRTKWRFLWPASFAYLLVTGGFPYTVVMLLLLVAWLSVKTLVQSRNILSVLPML